MAASDVTGRVCMNRNEPSHEDSSESEQEIEPAEAFHRRLSTNRDIKHSAAVKEGFLLKQTWSFQRWRRRYFKLRGRTLYYAKDTKAAIFDEVDLTELSCAECSIKNINNSFQVITPYRRLVLAADTRRDMEEWTAALKAANTREYYEGGEHHDLLSGNHHWYATSHARPTYCNVCREALSGVTSHGLSCEVCKCKVHKRCAAKAICNCKWTTLASVGKDIIEEENGDITMPHQWMEGNLPVSAKCAVCDKTCGSVLRLQDWRCLWCRATVHTACRPSHPVQCPLGPSRVSVVPPTALHIVGSDDAWEAVRPQGCSPLLVFVNSKSGDNQGVKFLRRFKQLLNPAQVFDLISGGPGLGLGLFRHFDPFRILVCSGDGSVGWVLSEIDRLHMHKQCQVGVLPLGTGNDLARVLGWGSSCDDDAHLPQLLDKYEKASTKMLDRWSIMAFERSIAMPERERKLSTDNYRSMSAYEDSVVSHLTKILQSDQHSTVISSAKVLCETVKDFTVRAAEISLGQGDEQFGDKCQLLRDKLEMLLLKMHHEEENTSSQETLDVLTQNLRRDSKVSIPEVSVDAPDGEEKSNLEKQEKDYTNFKERKNSFSPQNVQNSSLVSRANSLKRAVRQLVEYTEQAVDDQNKAATTRRDSTIEPTRRFLDIPGLRGMDTLKVSPPSSEASPCPSPLPVPPTDFLSISPLPDLRRDSTGCDDLLTRLPVPTMFADGRPLADDEDIKRFLPLDDTTETSDETVSDDTVRANRLSDNAEDEILESRFDHELGEFVLKQISSSESINVRSFEAPDYADIAPTYQHFRSHSLVPPSQPPEPSLPRCSSMACLDSIAHIDSPETSEPTLNSRSEPGENGLCESSAQDDSSSILGIHLSFLDHECSLGETSSSADTCDEQELRLVKGCSLARFSEGSDIGRKSVYRHIRAPKPASDNLEPDKPVEEATSNEKTKEDCGLLTAKLPDTDTSKERMPLLLVPKIDSEHKEESGFLTAKFDNDRSKEGYGLFPPKQETGKPKEGGGLLMARHLDVVNITIQGSNNNICVGSSSDLDVDCRKLSFAAEMLRKHSFGGESGRKQSYSGECGRKQSFGGECGRKQSYGGEFRINREVSTEDESKDFPEVISFIVEPPSPVSSPPGRHPLQMEDDDVVFRRSSTGKLTPSASVFGLSCSPAATRRISSGSLLKAPDGTPSSAHFSERSKSISDDQRRQLPIINPLVRLPMWPNVSGAGLISKVLLANADALCAAVSPLMDPDETLMEGFYERSVMNNYFGIGIDAKISLDFHQKREEHPEKCRSRAKNYMWYGVLGSKEWLQKTYKNLEQRVQLECDGQRIPLPSLQGIVILNIPSFMGGTNFWGGTKEDDCFLAPSFDDRILEVVAVFGSVQMAASRLINLQHHRIAQCSSIQINILGDEGVPIQVDGEAWIQPPGMIRIIHKNRMQMLCRNRSLEESLKSWEVKQKSSVATPHGAAQTSQQTVSADGKPCPFSVEENQLLLGFIESATTLVKYVKLLTISHPSIEAELYQLAAMTSAHMEKVHPGGKIVDGPNLRPQVTELVGGARQLYEEACSLLREKAHSLKLREDLEGKLSAALGNMEMELRKCVTYDSVGLVHFQQPTADEQSEGRKGRAGRGLSWLKFRRGHSGVRVARDVAGWGVTEVAAWLDSLGLAEYAESFTRHDIRGREVLTLGRRDLKELGVTKVGHVKRILQGIRDLST